MWMWQHLIGCLFACSRLCRTRRTWRRWRGWERSTSRLWGRSRGCRWDGSCVHMQVYTTCRCVFTSCWLPVCCCLCLSGAACRVSASSSSDGGGAQQSQTSESHLLQVHGWSPLDKHLWRGTTTTKPIINKLYEKYLLFNFTVFFSSPFKSQHTINKLRKHFVS